jgi:signal transduction histidine kinase
MVGAVLALVSVAIDAVLARALRPALQRAALISITVIPALALLTLRRVTPRLAAAILGPLDPPRARRKATLERVLRDTASVVEPSALFAVTDQALRELTGADRIRFLKGPHFPSDGKNGMEPLPPALAEALRPGVTLFLHASELAAVRGPAYAALQALPAQLVLAVRSGDRLQGALALAGGAPDRATIESAVALADHLGTKLGQYGLFHQTYRLQQELEETRRLAALGAFAAAIAHDVRTPLTSVQMNIQMLRAKSTLSPDDMESFDIALDELARVNRHITQILDYGKPVQLQAVDVNVRDVADAAARRIEPMLSERRLSLEIDHEPQVSAVRGDAQHIGQVVMNLLDNAANASRAGGTIHLRTRATDERRVAIEVIDRGRGIDAADLPKIFEPFFTTRSDGTGLGLAIASKLVRAHGGEIAVRSEIGQGSIFTILLPVAAAGSG